VSFDLQKSIVRILKENGETAGTGFVLDKDGLIATCAHVIWSDGESRPRPEKVSLVFHTSGETRRASVVGDWWRTSQAEDVAILRLDGPLPQECVALLPGTSQGTSEHPFDTFGFPRSNPKDGIWGTGQILRATSLQNIPVLQLSSKEVTPGFSGAPVVDRLTGRVVGMVTAITPSDQYGRLAETAFATPTETLRAVCSDLTLSDLCPYQSLKAFTEAEAAFFFGRQSTIEDLLAALHKEPRLLPVLGPSGSGKSSLVQAGLIPRLRQGGRGAPAGSDRWEIVVARPITDPLQELAVHGLLDEHNDLLAGLRAWFERSPEKTRLLLVFDQFEELFVTCPPEVRQNFLHQLSTLLTEELPVTVLLIMRDDFYSRLAQHESLGRLLSQGLINVPPTLKHDELNEMVRKPAERTGIAFESDDLIELIIRDAETSDRNELSTQGADSTILPLLEFTLTQLWERRQDGVLTLQAYQTIGGVTGALTQWADATYHAFKEKEQQRLARRIFTDLVHLGNHSQKLPDSRQCRPLSTLWRSEDEQEAVQQIIQRLVEARLLVTGRDSASNEETVEIIHDSLLREWGLLRSWLEEDRRFLLWHQKLQERLAEWVETNPADPTGRENDKLLQGSDLAEALGKWLKDHTADLTQEERDFILTSQHYKEQKEQDWKQLYERAEQQRQIALAQNLAAQAELLYSQRPDLLELGVLLGIQAVQRYPCPETDRALRSGSMLLRQRLATLNCSEVAEVLFTPAGKQLLTILKNGEITGLEKASEPGTTLSMKLHPTVFAAVLNLDGHLLAAANSGGGKGIEDPLSGHIFPMDGDHEQNVQENIDQARTQSLIADIMALDDNHERGGAEVWNLAGQRRLVSVAHQNWVTHVALSPDGRLLATASEDGTAGLWEIADGSQRASFQHKKSVYAVTFSPDSRLLATASEDGTAGLWETNGGKRVATLRHQKNIYTIAFSPDGHLLATASEDGTAGLWDVATGRQVASLPHRNTVNAVAFSPNGLLLATASGDATAGLWDVATARLLVSLPHQKSVYAVTFSPDGKLLATASYDQTAGVWDVVTGRRIASLVHAGKVKKLAFSPGAQQLVTVSAGRLLAENVVTIWDIGRGQRLAPLVHHGEVARAAFSSDGALLVTSFAEDMLGVWNVASGQPLAFVADGENFVNTRFTWQDVQAKVEQQTRPAEYPANALYLTSSPSRALQAFVDANDLSIVEVRRAHSEQEPTTLVHESEVKYMLFSPDEHLLATIIDKADSGNQIVTVWDLATGHSRASFIHEGLLNQLVFSPQGDLLATGGIEHTACVWETASGRCLASFSHERAVCDVAFSPDNRLLASASEDDTAKVWEIASGRCLISLAHLRPVTAVVFNPISHLLATASRDSTARIWDITTGRCLAAFAHLRPLTGLTFSPDGRLLATSSEDWTAQIWPWRPEDLLSEAQARLTRNLTALEWQQYLGNEPYPHSSLNQQ
jgi:WD40 repeat protein